MEYKKSITRVHRSLTPKEQKELYEQMQDGDSYAREVLINSCFPLVIKIAEKFSVNNKHIDIEDLIQEGNIALVNSVDKWNPSISNSITTLVYHSVTNALINTIQKAKYKINSPYSMTSYATKIINKINSVDSDDPTVISEKTGLSISKVKNFMSRNFSRKGLSRANGIKQQSLEDCETPNHYCVGHLIEIVDKNIEEPNKSIFKEFYGLSGKRKKSVQLSKEHEMSIKDVVSIINRTRTRLSKLAKREMEDAEILRQGRL